MLGENTDYFLQDNACPFAEHRRIMLLLFLFLYNDLYSLSFSLGFPSHFAFVCGIRSWSFTKFQVLNISWAFFFSLFCKSELCFPPPLSSPLPAKEKGWKKLFIKVILPRIKNLRHVLSITRKPRFIHLRVGGSFTTDPLLFIR